MAVPTNTKDPRPKPDNREAEAWKGFWEEAKDHKLTVLRESGLYRHLHVGTPGSGHWSWDIMSWPGYLAITGDIADGFSFTRVEDMFNFFEIKASSWDYYSDGAPSIDFRYWAEKLCGGRSRDMKVFSDTTFLESLKCQLEDDSDIGLEHEQDLREQAKEIGGQSQDVVDLLVQAQGIKNRRTEILASAKRSCHDQASAYRWIELHHADVPDPSEIDMLDWDIHFLFACYAIALSMKLYREHQAAHPAPDDYVLLEGGIVQNNPALPVYNLEVLDADAADDDTAQEALTLFRRMTNHRSVREGWSEAIDRAEAFIRDYGTEATVAALNRTMARNKHQRDAFE